MLDVSKTLAEIEVLHEKQPLQDHPLYSRIVNGDFNKRQIQEYVKQYSIIPLHNHNYHGPLYVVCPDYRWRARLAEVVYEEGTGRLYSDGVPHNELYMEFAEDLGIPRKEMMDVRYCAESIAIGQFYNKICSRNFLEGCSAHMLAGERQGVGWMTTFANSMRKNYGLTDKGAKFWIVHDKADEDHSSIGTELLHEFAKTEDDLKMVIETCRITLAMSKMFYDGIMNSMDAVV
ncbi:MAG TPA: iron-containing redox enzyme family protein [Magnetospirillaceae bacterium]